MKRGLHCLPKRPLLIAALGLFLPLSGALAQPAESSTTGAGSGVPSDVPAASTPSGTQFDDSQMQPDATRSPADPGAQGPIRSETLDEPMRDRERNMDLRRDQELGPGAVPDAGSSESGRSSPESERERERNAR